LPQQGGQTWYEQQGKHRGRDNPGSEALNDPVDFPGPPLDGPERNEVTGGGQPADPVIENSNQRIRYQFAHLGVLLNATRTTGASRVGNIVMDGMIKSEIEFLLKYQMRSE
jgi:hypothetical protein